MAYDYDLFVIGAGSGGVRAARLASLNGARVCVAEADRVGGTCVVRGCVPKKFMVYAAEFSHAFEDARGFGWTIPEPTFDWKRFLARKDDEIARLSGAYATNLQKAGADLVHARAVLRDAHTIELVGKNQTITADKILIATGGRVWRPDFPGAEFCITSDEAFHLPDLPKSILIAGGGYIAVEFAGIFAGLGVETTLLYRGPTILRGFDEDIRNHLADEMVKRGVRIIVGSQHERIEKTDKGLVNYLTHDAQPLTTDAVMLAVGRRAWTEGLGLESAGVETNEDGTIKVDDYSRTTSENIWAIGDVTGRLNLTPVAIREAVAFVDTVFLDKPTAYDHAVVPTAVFSQPPVGTVGMTEAEARKGVGKVDIYLTRFRPMKVAFQGGSERTLMKLIVCCKTDQILGVHIVGPDAPEMVQMAAIAVKMGVTKAQWDSTTALHPTAAEELVTLREKHVAHELAAAE
ncbi:MAG TPA: glutathione-disulfide reductase [Caulobacteraceae bacterium]|nr:glutathione-disulfide reductase [Caulobacteraceae bacterium]